MLNENSNTNRKLWSRQWAYKEAAIIVLVLFVVGIAMEWMNGISSLPYLVFPLNLYIGLAYICLLIGLYLFFQKTKYLQFIKSVPTAIMAVGYFAFVSMLMGLFLQSPKAEGIIAVLSLNKVTDSWYFLFANLFILTSLGFLIIDKAAHFKWKYTGILISHLGLWIVLFAGGLGSFEITRLEMQLTEGEINGIAEDKSKNLQVNMPFALYLDDFILEEYPPTLGIVNNETGKLWHKQGQNIRILGQDSVFLIEDWHIEVLEYIDFAAKAGGQYYFYNEIGSSPAAKMRVIKEQDTVVGWITCGSFSAQYEGLKLSEQYSLIMLFPEPKNYISDIELYTAQGKQREFRLEVNKPFEYEGWEIYQVNYDDEFGKWSNNSTVELIRDPWLPIIYLGIFLMIAGAIYLFWFGRRVKE